MNEATSHWLGAWDPWCLRPQKEEGCPAGDEVGAVLELVVHGEAWWGHQGVIFRIPLEDGRSAAPLHMD